MLVPKGFLHRVKLPVGRQTLDGDDLVAISLHREHGAGFDRPPVEHHGASAAYRGLAADMRTGQARDLAQVVNQKEPRLDFIGVWFPVDGERYLTFHLRIPAPIAGDVPRRLVRYQNPGQKQSGPNRAAPSVHTIIEGKLEGSDYGPAGPILPAASRLEDLH